VEAVVERIAARRWAYAPKSIATGGLADVVAKQTPVVDAVDPI